MTAIDISVWRDKWTTENDNYIDTHSVVESLVKMFGDAARDGVTRLEFPVTYCQFVYDATDRCQPWARWESWGPYHLFVNVNGPVSQATIKSPK
jgi:hypothetical protein